MPKVLSRQPRWLDHASPGYSFFQPDDKSKTIPTSSQRHYKGPLRTIAHRGTELFVAVGNELRWSEVGILRDSAEEAQRGRGSLFATQRRSNGNDNDHQERKYRILKTPVALPIQQLSVSPSGDFIAILTSHTCHVCVLPSRRHLTFQSSKDAIRLPSFQVGPTAHVLEQSPLVNALWHPLSPTGNALVTTTKDACVRLWELDSKNRSTFDEPALAVDLKKLANATSVREDFSASKYGVNKGFSPDDVEMQLAASCFGGRGSEDEHGWASMTLWVAMSEGDVYALCPFLPSRFRAPATLLPSLSTSVVASTRIFSQDQFVSTARKTLADQQCKWLAELDAQEPLALLSPSGGGAGVIEIYNRPERPGAVPKLQGPFQLTPEPDFGEITDIHVIAPKINDDELFDEGQRDDAFDLGNEGLSVGVVCLATNTSRVHICLDVDGVEAEWLPTKRSRAYTFDDEGFEDKELLLFETVDLARGDDQVASDDWWPTFTASPVDRYELFSTQATGVYGISLRPWISSLENELTAPQLDTEGIGFRLGVILDSASTLVDTITSEFSEPLRGVNAAVAIVDPLDSDIGYVVLTSALHIPFAAILDLPSNINPFAPDATAPAVGLLPVPEPRAPYQPGPALTTPTTIPSQLANLHHQSSGASASASDFIDLKSPLSFTAGSLQKITDAHRLLSTETHRLGLAVADLFRQCERMVSELRAETARARALAHRIDVVTGENEFPDPVPEGQPPPVRGGKLKIADRVADSHNTTAALLERVERLRGKLRRLPTSGAGAPPLSLREAAFAEEVQNLARGLALGTPGKRHQQHDDARSRALTPSSSLLSPSTTNTATTASDSPERVRMVKMEGSTLTTSTLSAFESPSSSFLDGSKDEDADAASPAAEDGSSLTGRFAAVQTLYESLRAQATLALEKSGAGGEAEASAAASSTSPPLNDYRQQALARVHELLARESAMLDAVSDRLERLQRAAGASA